MPRIDYDINKRPKTLVRTHDEVIKILSDLIAALEIKTDAMETRLKSVEDRIPDDPGPPN